MPTWAANSFLKLALSQSYPQTLTAFVLDWPMDRTYDCASFHILARCRDDIDLSLDN